jgi:16S rRNA C967 or C1407 C5-methylase (RsmB/RsmF family)
MPRGDVVFASHFGAIYGERWGALMAAMDKPQPKVALWNRYTKLAKPSVEESGMEEFAIESGVACFKSADPDCPELASPPRDEHGVPAYYLLDLASVLVAEALQVDSFHKVLDMCAAPGGKSVAICQYLTEGGSLVANEASGERNRRLRRTLQDHIPTKHAPEVAIAQKDGTRWHMPSTFDRVLIDAPCSSERHLVLQADGLLKWTPKLTQDQAAVQLTLVLRGLETLKVGGILVYSTCSISPAENDELVTSALKRTRVGVEIVKKVLQGAEATPLGASMHLPDTAAGMGPMYCCVLKRVAEHRLSSDDEDSSIADSSDDDEESD